MSNKNIQMELLLTACKRDKTNKVLSEIPKSLLSNKDFVLEVLEENVEIASFINKKLLKDEEIMLIILKKLNDFKKVIPQNVKHDTSVEIVAFNANDEFFILNIDEKISNKKEFVKEIVKHNAGFYPHIDKDLQNDYEIITNALNCETKQNPYILEFINKENLLKLRNENEFLINRDLNTIYNINAIKTSSDVYKYVLLSVNSGEKINRELAKKILNKNGNCLELLPKFNNDKELVLMAVMNNVNSVSFISKDFENDKEIFYKALVLNENYYKLLGKELKNDIEFLKTVIDINPKVYNLLDEKFKVKDIKDKKIVEKDF